MWGWAWVWAWVCFVFSNCDALHCIVVESGPCLLLARDTNFMVVNGWLLHLHPSLPCISTLYFLFSFQSYAKKPLVHSLEKRKGTLLHTATSDP